MNVMKKGFTIIELLVCLAIIGLLVAIVLPATLMVRESSRRVFCSNNLKQIGLALQNYESVYRQIPPAMIWNQRGEPFGAGMLPIGVIDHVAFGMQSDPLNMNWLVFLLPYIEHSTVFSNGNVNLAIDNISNKNIRMVPISVFRCPSDPFVNQDYDRGFFAHEVGHTYSRGNYAMNMGPNTPCLTTNPNCRYGFVVDSGDLLNKASRLYGGGVGGFNVSFRFAQFTNGLSNIVAVDEIRAGASPADLRGTWALGFVGASLTAAHPGSPNTPEGDGLAPCAYLIAQFGEVGLAAKGLPCQTTQSIANWAAAARSSHVQSVNTLRLDGSVQIVPNSIDRNTWLKSHLRDHEVADFLTQSN